MGHFLRNLLRFLQRNRNTGGVSTDDVDVSTPQGMRVVAFVEGTKKERESFFDECISSEITDETPILFMVCGHTAPRSGNLNIYGHVLTLKTEKGKKEIDSQCIACVAAWFVKHAIRCCFCGYGIIPGDGVALYGKDSGDVHRDGVTLVDGCAIGCTLSNCCPSGGFFAGNWTTEGFVSIAAQLKGRKRTPRKRSQPM